MSYDPLSNPKFTLLNVSQPSIDLTNEFYEYIINNKKK